MSKLLDENALRAVKTYVDNGFLPLTGGTLTGQLTLGDANNGVNLKIGIQNDSYGLMPYAHNWNQIGSSSLYWYRSFITRERTSTLEMNATDYNSWMANTNGIMCCPDSNNTNVMWLASPTRRFGVTNPGVDGYVFSYSAFTDSNAGNTRFLTLPSSSGTLALTSQIPTSLPANGGNADTVDNKHASDFLSVNGGTLNGSLEIFSTGSSWNEGIRIHPASNDWSGVVFCEKSNSGSSASSTNTWSIHNHEGLFGLYKNGSSSSSADQYLCNEGGTWTLKGSSKNGTIATTSDIPTVNNGTLTIQANGVSRGTFTANQSGNSTINITAGDLGLSSAMHFLGTTTSSISDGSTTNPVTIGGNSVTAAAGDVVLSGHKEFVWTGSAWELLGDEGSYALNSVQVIAGTGLSGGGAISGNVTLNHSNSVTAQSTQALYPITYDAQGHITGSGSAVTSLPANGGNADTVDNEHASAFAHLAGGTSSSHQSFTGFNDFSRIVTFSGGVATDTIESTRSLAAGGDVLFNSTVRLAAFKPSSDNDYSLGTGSLRWKNVYVSGNLSDGTNSVAVANIITSSNIGSQSVNYATSAGNSDTVDGEHSSAFVHVSGDSMTGSLHVCSDSSSVAPNNAAIEVRERNRGSNTLSETYENAPRIGFHWQNRYWGNLAYMSEEYRFMNEACTQFRPVRASKISIDNLGNTNAGSATMQYNSSEDCIEFVFA